MQKITLLLLLIINIAFTSNHTLHLSEEEKKYIYENPKIIVANELDWIPYDYYEKGEPKGFVIDYIKLVFSKVNLNAQFVSNNWSSLLKDFKKGDIDVLPVISYNKQREEYISYSKAYTKQNFSLVTNISRSELFNLDDLKGKTLAVQKNTALTRHLKKHYPKIKQKEFETISEIFNAVKNNIVDGTIQNKIISKFYVNIHHNTTKIISSINFPLYDNNLYVGMQKDNKILNSIINKGINLVSEEELYNLEEKWSNINRKLYFTKEEKEFIKNTIINIGYTDNWAPFSFEENGLAYGLGFDFWQYILEKSNLKHTLKFKSNFSYALNDFKNKNVDILLTTSKTKDREKYAIFSDIYHTSPIGFATTKDKNYIPNVKSIKDKKIDRKSVV